MVDFVPEIGAAVFLAIYGLFFLVGKRKNERRALEFFQKNYEVLAENFTRVMNPIKVSQSEYRWKCTGRLNCVGMEANMEVRKLSQTFSEKHSQNFFAVQENARFGAQRCRVRSAYQREN